MFGENEAIRVPSFQNYRYNRTTNKLYRGIFGNIEVRPDSDGVFHMKKGGYPNKHTKESLLAITDAKKMRKSPAKIDGQKTLNKDEIIEDFKNGLDITTALKKYHISHPTAKKYRIIATGA